MTNDSAAAEATPSTRSRGVRSLGGYQPGLDGIRALAVLAVAAYHAQLPHTSGGFLGVSLFFTLSGFLITALLLDEHAATGSIDLKQFWIRRFRRLVPAALLGLVVVLVFAATVATRNQLDGLPGEVTSSAAYFANWFFAYTDQSYAELFSSPSPVQHYWSLAIEEQFYLLMPLILIAILRRRASVTNLLAVLVGLIVASSGWMFIRYNGGTSIDRLYYGTDTRAAELLVGAALAAALHLVGLERLRRLATPSAIIGPLVAVGLLWAWATQSLTGATLFRGGFLLHALASAVLVVSILIDRGPLTTLLKVAPLVFLGRISYGVYLFHWPIFLWLTSERTGLGQWPLFAVRLALAIALATASFFLLEQPIRRGTVLRLPKPARLAAAPLAAALIIGGTQIASGRDAFDEAATIRESPDGLGLPIATADGVLDILVISAATGSDVVDELVAQTADAATIRIVRSPFACTGGFTSIDDASGDASGETCANWAADWPALVDTHDPDVVILQANDWPELDVPGGVGGDAAADAARSTELLSTGLDLLAANGAPILWALVGAANDDDLARKQRPFSQSLILLSLRRDDLFSASFSRAGAPAKSGDARNAARGLLEDAALYQRSDRSGLAKVLVVGDSQALSMGFGLQQWGEQHKTAWVWNRGALGCSFSVDGIVRLFGDAPVSDECREAVDSFDRLIERFDPDLVIALPGLWDMLPRKLDRWDDFKSLGDTDFDSYVTSQLRSAQQRLSARGATVVWMSAPCLGEFDQVDTQVRVQNVQRAIFNDTILSTMLNSEPGAEFFDLDEALCPGGVALDTLPSGDAVRYDGLHFSIEGADWFAETYGPRLLDFIGG